MALAIMYRQVMRVRPGAWAKLLDVERRQGTPIRIVMAGGGTATVVESAESLLPFNFKL